MRYCVTGCLGFVGSAFVRDTLFSNGDDTITGVARVSNQRHLMRIESVQSSLHHDRFRLYYADLSRDPLSEIFDGVDTVIHMAARTFVDRSISDPEPFIQSNIIGTYRLLEAIRKDKGSIKKILYMSTDEEYGAILEGAYTEESRINPSNIYAATKVAGTALCLAYKNTFGLPIIITRCENIHGEFQGVEKVLPVFTRKALAGQPLPIYGDGSHVRQWIHVSDVVDAFHHLLAHGNVGEIYHVAGNQELKNLELAKRVLRILGKPEDRVEFVSDYGIRPGHDKRYALSTDKIRATGWVPKLSLDEGLEKTVKWYVGSPWWFQ